jgi:hypothetical protein
VGSEISEQQFLGPTGVETTTVEIELADLMVVFDHRTAICQSTVVEPGNVRF